MDVIRQSQIFYKKLGRTYLICISSKVSNTCYKDSERREREEAEVTSLYDVVLFITASSSGDRCFYRNLLNTIPIGNLQLFNLL